VTIKKISDYSGLKQYTDTDLVTDIVTRRSVSCIVREYNSVAFAWKANKQCVVALGTHDVETRAFFEGIRRTKSVQKIF